MLEGKLAEAFDKAFAAYQLWKPQNKQAGWPDRGIQLGESKLVWCELKTTSFRKDNTILISNFEQEQAAFMFKWQKARGYCFLLVALARGQEEYYGIVTQMVFKDWLSLNRRILSTDHLTLFANSMIDVLNWFRIVYVKKDKYVSHR